MTSTLSPAFGQLVPYGDPNWYQGWHSPYYNKSHHELRAFTRAWVDKHIAPNCHDWDEQKSIPKEVMVLLLPAAGLLVVDDGCETAQQALTCCCMISRG